MDAETESECVFASEWKKILVFSSHLHVREQSKK